MEIRRGQIVRSKAGRDKGDFQVILRIEQPYAIVCDGRRRSLEKPKKNKLMHRAPADSVLAEEMLQTNRQIKAALRAFRSTAEDDTTYR